MRQGINVRPRVSDWVAGPHCNKITCDSREGKYFLGTPEAQFPASRSALRAEGPYPGWAPQPPLYHSDRSPPASRHWQERRQLRSQLQGGRRPQKSELAWQLRWPDAVTEAYFTFPQLERNVRLFHCFSRTQAVTRSLRDARRATARPMQLLAGRLAKFRKIKLQAERPLG